MIKPYVFTPPVAPEYRGTHPMFRRVVVEQGVSVLLIDGAYVQTQMPTAEQADAASEVYLGGYTYRITSLEAEGLIAAGYEDYVNATTLITAYGAGPYGADTYGS